MINVEELKKLTEKGMLKKEEEALFQKLELQRKNEEEAAKIIEEIPERCREAAELGETRIFIMKICVINHFEKNRLTIPITEKCLIGVPKIICDYCKAVGLKGIIEHNGYWSFYVAWDGLTAEEKELKLQEEELRKAKRKKWWW